MHQKRTSFSLGSCIGYILLFSSLAITAGGGQSNQNKVKTSKRDSLARARQIDTQATERLRSDIKNKLYCTHINCWQKAATCTQHTQAHLRLLPPVLLNKIGQFLGAPSGLLHQLTIKHPIAACLPSDASSITIVRTDQNKFSITLRNQDTSECLKSNRDKYPHILCVIQPPLPDIKPDPTRSTPSVDNYRLSYDREKSTGYIYTCTEQSQPHILGEITPLHGGFIARYVALRQLGIPMQTAQRYNRMESDLPRRIKQPKPERTASRMLGVAAQDE